MKVDRTVTTRIDPERCTGCGLCIEVCPEETISLRNKKAVITGASSLNCGHCAAVCPTGAISVAGIDPSLTSFSSFSLQEKWLPHGRPDTADLVHLMLSRRSCRNFRSDAVARDLLEDLVKIGVTAPSGSNCQPWTFTILPDRDSVDALGRRTAQFFRKLNRMAEKSWLRAALRVMGKPELEEYYQAYFESVQEGLVKYDTGKKDLLFHGAPAAIIVGASQDASCPAEDALLATQNILLGAHSLGLGTCLIGFVVAAMKADKGIGRFLGLPRDEKAYAVIAVGYPAETYQRVAGRKKARIRFVRLPAA
ncbi:MAG: nitroreductase family protein [Thermodesulfobacteriota bacterium]